MKGKPEPQAAVYHTFNFEDLIEPGHPLHAIKRMVDRALGDKHVGREKIRQCLELAAAAYNLVRMKNLLAP